MDDTEEDIAKQCTSSSDVQLIHIHSNDALCSNCNEKPRTATRLVPLGKSFSEFIPEDWHCCLKQLSSVFSRTAADWRGWGWVEVGMNLR
jgi:hypothetical protein